VEITRPKNDAITDIIEGASLNLHKRTAGAAQITVRANTEKITDLLKEWVTAHNELMMFLRENSQPGESADFKNKRPKQTDDDLSKGFETLQDTHGVFAGDALVRRIITTMQSATGRSYPAISEPGYRILSDIGISTGAPGKNWDDIKNGYLEIDEAKLASVLRTAPFSVRDLFASDTNSDARTDNGVAYTLSEDLAPYTRNAGGLITLRIDTVKTKITDNKTRIDKMELSLKSKEQNLRQKFGRMERSMSESRSVGRSLQNSLGRQQ
jgi:flagellar hook-associated protein 2